MAQSKPIRGFRGKYRFLSNFYPSPIAVDAGFCWAVFPTAEHLYQAYKATNLADVEFIRTRATPGEAKVAGRNLVVRSDWTTLRYRNMCKVIRRKFLNFSSLGHLLVKTGQRELIELNTWGDMYWGVCEGVGDNHLGKILMRVRRNLRL